MPMCWISTHFMDKACFGQSFGMRKLRFWEIIDKIICSLEVCVLGKTIVECAGKDYRDGAVVPFE